MSLPKKGDSYCDENKSLNVFDGTKWNKITFDYDLKQAIRDLEIMQRKVERIIKIKRLIND